MEDYMLNEKLRIVLKEEGVVTIVTWTDSAPHIVNTWNSFMTLTEDERILIPAYAMRTTEKNLNINPSLKLAFGSKNVSGYNDYPGTGFVLEGTGRFIDSGSEFDMMKGKFSFLTRVLEITPSSAKQML